jgi:hypothetical protein
MRSKWALAAAAVLALVVVGGIGGVTMRAFAGVVHGATKTTTVTRLCVYVDHTHPGSSYGDYSADPKYGHKTCITGKRGPAGDTNVITWNMTVAQPIAPPTNERWSGKGFPAGAVDLAKVGPFTIQGLCESGEGVGAATLIKSSADGSFLAWDGSSYNGNFNSGNVDLVSNWAVGVPGEPDFINEGTYGDFSVSTGDNTTAFTATASEGVYMNGADGPACSFIGHLVIENPSS